MQIPGKISKAFSDELFSIINPGSVPVEEIKYDPEKAMKIVTQRMLAIAEINELEHEINKTLERLGTENTFIIKSYSIEELVIGVKHYLIAWSTMKDVMTNLINICFDLGIDEKDVSYGVVTRNKKVKSSNILDIFKNHEKAINVRYTDRQRNDATHRGKLLDHEINEFRKIHNSLYSRKYSLLNINPITDEEFKKELEALNSELVELVKLKRKEYSEHFEKTLELNQDLARELARVTANEILGNRI
jgi:hypothetical protein